MKVEHGVVNSTGKKKRLCFPRVRPRAKGAAPRHRFPSFLVFLLSSTSARSFMDESRFDYKSPISIDSVRLLFSIPAGSYRIVYSDGRSFIFVFIYLFTFPRREMAHPAKRIPLAAQSDVHFQLLFSFFFVTGNRAHTRFACGLSKPSKTQFNPVKPNLTQ